MRVIALLFELCTFPFWRERRALIENLSARVVKWVMGIQGLMKLIGDYAPSAVKDNDIKNYFGEGCL